MPNRPHPGVQIPIKKHHKNKSVPVSFFREDAVRRKKNKQGKCPEKARNNFEPFCHSEHSDIVILNAEKDQILRCTQDDKQIENDLVNALFTLNLSKEVEVTKRGLRIFTLKPKDPAQINLKNKKSDPASPKFPN